MNFGFYVFGTPNGYNQYPADGNSTAFQEFSQSATAESQMTVKRSGQLVYYVYVQKLTEKSANFLGFCLVFNGVYCGNPKKLFRLFSRAYFDVELKGEFLRFDKAGSNYAIGKFAEKLLEVERIKTFFKHNIENDSIYNFVNLPSSFKFGGGKKTISIQETGADILGAIAEYEVVHIANNEKAVSELERTKKMLTDLWAEQHALQQSFNKLLAKKKQYRIVLVLCLILIGCGAGLVAFNKNLQSRDSQISGLNTEIVQKNIEIENLKNDVAQLETDKQKLVIEKVALRISVSKLNTIKTKLTATVNQLRSVIYENTRQAAAQELQD